MTACDGVPRFLRAITSRNTPSRRWGDPRRCPPVFACLHAFLFFKGVNLNSRKTEGAVSGRDPGLFIDITFVVLFHAFKRNKPLSRRQKCFLLSHSWCCSMFSKKRMPLSPPEIYLAVAFLVLFHAFKRDKCLSPAANDSFLLSHSWCCSILFKETNTSLPPPLTRDR